MWHWDIVNQAGNWKYLDFEDSKHSKPESAKINKTHQHWNTFKSGGGTTIVAKHLTELIIIPYHTHKHSILENL